MKLVNWLVVIGVIMLNTAAVVLATDVKPVAMSNKWIGGSDVPGNPVYTHGVQNGMGVNNIGLLIKTWGKVTYCDPLGKFFYIDDGSARKDGTKNGTQDVKGVRVSIDQLAPGNSIGMPASGALVTIVGVISTWQDSANKVWPNVRPRNQQDVVTAQ